MSVFIAFTIPPQALASIRDTMRSYQDVLETSVPQEQWHCTMLFLGDSRLSAEQIILLTQPIRQSFHPVVNVLSLGQGNASHQLWAYIQDQHFLQDIRKELMRRTEDAHIALPESSMQPFIPHIHVGNTQQDTKPLSVPDIPVKTKFSLSELLILQDYETLGTIPITP